MIKIITGLWPFVRDLAFSKDLGATKGRWRRVTRISLIAQFVLICMVVVCFHQVLVQVDLRTEKESQLRKVEEELALMRLICVKGCASQCNKDDDLYYDNFFGKD